ncbi:hypothetical protein 16Q_004c [Pseudomonas phage 16Q]|nr:hypothetical protein 16Q_004c [Pseudomonas phage 16Q]
MTAKAPTPPPEGVKRPPAPAAPPMRVGVNGHPCPICGSGMKPRGIFGLLFNSYKGCYHSECTNYWRKDD